MSSDGDYYYSSDDVSSDEESCGDYYEYVLKEVARNGLNLMWKENKYRRNRVIAMTAVNNNGKAMKYVRESLRDDYEFAMDILSSPLRRFNDKYILKYLSDSLRDDREIVLAAVKLNGDALKYASENLQYDTDVILNAVISKPSAIVYAGYGSSINREFLLMIIKVVPDVLFWIDDYFRYDRDFVLEAMSVNGLAYLSVSWQRFKYDKEIYLTALNNCGNNTDKIINAAIRFPGHGIKFQPMGEQSDIYIRY